MTPSAFTPIDLASGASLSNRFVLAPLTNQQSQPDGTLTDHEIGWLLSRADGGFGTVMTAAAHVSPEGQGFAGQLGAFSDAHELELRRLAAGLRARNCCSSLQLHHAG